ncbi:MAG: methyl-accepting chemotaxis protein, partial [Methylomonas sp.]
NVLLRGNDPQKLAKYWKNFQEKEASVEQESGKLMAGLPESAVRQKVEAFITAHQKMAGDYRRGLTAFTEANADPHAGDNAVTGIDRAPTELLDEAVMEIEKRSAEVATIADNEAERSFRSGLAVLLITLGSGVAVFELLIRKSIVIPTRSLVEELQRLADGKLAHPVNLQASGGEIGLLAKNAESLRLGLTDVISKAKDSSMVVANGSREMYQSASAILRDAETQSEIASSMAREMDELGHTISQISKEAEAVRRNAESAGKNAQAGQKLLENQADAIHAVAIKLADTVQKVSEFADCASNISALTQEVKEIADQTNLLALNAAIEAARAGEQGRGFAVVAEEVRKLADKSAKSASQIASVAQALESNTAMVGHSIIESNQDLAITVSHSDQVSTSLVSTFSAINAIGYELATITDAVYEQRRTVELIATQSAQLARQSEQNSASVRLIHGNLDQMNLFSRDLQESMFAFQV